MTWASVGETVRQHFTLLEEDGITPITGLLDGDFTKTLIRNDAVSTVTPTITEVGVTGIYAFSFVPDLDGVWYSEVYVPSTEDRFSDQVRVGPSGAPFGFLINEAQLNVAYDETISTLFMEVWLDRNGQSVEASDLVSCSVVIYDSDGVELFTESSAVPGTNGRFGLTHIGGEFSQDRPYNAIVSVTDAVGTVVTYQAFTMVG